MMKKLFSLLFTLTTCLFTLAQADEPATAPSLTVDYWSLGAYTGSSLTGATGSGLAGYCQGAPTNDVFYAFTAVTQGVKVSCTTADFDMVVEIRDAAYNVVDCSDAVAGVGGEELWSTTLVVGDTYYLCVYSNGAAGAGNFQTRVEYLPAVEVRNTFIQYPNPDIGLPGYKISESTRRVTNTAFPINMGGIIEATRWKIVDPVTLDEFYADVAGDNQLLNLNSVPGPLCFNKIYEAQCQVMLEGNWCGYSVTHELWTESEPNTELTASYIGGFYDLSANVKANFVGSEQQLNWRLITDNGNTQIDFAYPNNPTSWLNFPDVPCMRFNKIYQLQIAAEYCGVTGSYSAPVNIFTVNFPYTKVRDEYCNTDQYVGATILCDFIASIDTYAWLFAPIEQDDPEMTPIGPAIVAYTYNTTGISLMSLVSEGLTEGDAYAVAVKPILGNFDSCNEVQQGDYGQFCQVVIIDTGGAPGGGSPVEGGDGDKNDDIALDEKSAVWSNDMKSAAATQVFRTAGDRVVQLSLTGSGLEGNAVFTVHDINGRLIAQTQFPTIEEANVIQYGLPADAGTGIYILTVSTPEAVVSEKIFVE